MGTNLPVPSNNQELIQSFTDVEKLAKVFIESQLFVDTKGMNQAIVKILAGRELGIGVFQSMNDIHIIAGKICISPILLASILKSQNKYNYKVIEHNEHKCKIAFFEKGNFIGHSEFTIEDAKRLRLAERDQWQRQPKTMLFWRALSQGIRWYCPDLYRGLQVYTTEEMEEKINEEDYTVKIEDGIQQPEPPLTTDVDEKKELINQASKEPALNKSQVQKLLQLAEKKGINREEFEKKLYEKYGENIPYSAFVEIKETIDSYKPQKESLL